MGVVGRLDQYASILVAEFDDYSMSENLLTYSEQFDNASWAKNNYNVTANATTAPDGALTADKLIAINASTFHDLYKSPGLGSNTYTLSIFAKAAEQSFIRLRIDDGAISRVAMFNLSTGSVSSSSNVTSPTITSYSNGWYRCSITVTSAIVNAVFNGFPESSGAQYTGDGTSGIYIWGAQFEFGSVATDYTPTTTTSISRILPATTNTNITGLGTHYSSGFDENTSITTLVQTGENLLTYSNDFTTWTKQAISGGVVGIIPNNLTSPDGEINATRYYVQTAGSSFYSLFTGVSVSASTSYTYSVFIKPGESTTTGLVIFDGVGNASSTFNLNTGASTGTFSSANTTIQSAGSVNYGNGWYRYYITFSSILSGGFSVKIDLGTTTLNQGFYIYGAQVERGSVATDYIPTTGVSRSRSLPSPILSLSANISAPYDLVYDEFGGTLFGAGQGRYKRQNTDKSVIVYNEIDEVSDFRDIVRTGLVLDLDAGMNASFNNTGTTWNDLSGGATNFTLINPTYYSYSSSNNGSILFTRTTSPTPEDGGYATTTTTGSLTALTYLHNNHTTEVWFKSNNRNPTNYDGTEGVSALVVYTGYHSMFYYDATSFSYSIWGKDGSNADAAYTLAFADSSVGTWNQIVARRSGTELKLYLNGVLKNTGTINVLGTGTPTSNTLRLATANYNGGFSWHSNVNIASLKMYNKALTDNEISQNYNALKHRFGL